MAESFAIAGQGQIHPNPKRGVVPSVTMNQFDADLWEAFKILLVGLSWVALAITIKLLWDWRHNKSSKV